MTERALCASGDLAESGPGVRFALADPEKVGAGGTAPAFVVRFQGQVRAYLNRCGHVPVELDWKPGEFFDDSGLYLICATHGALYAPDSGRCVSGRCAGRGLRALRVTERDGTVYLIGEGEGGG